MSTPASSTHRVAVLCVRRDSIYRTLPGCDVYDVDRDARTFPGGLPVIAHPPCRSWGRLRAFANHDPAEHALGPWAVAQVRRWGGVLEHPAWSTLWSSEHLPLPGECSSAAGWTLDIDQHWFGHRAQKRTWLYIVGCQPSDIPPLPLRFEPVTHCVGTTRGRVPFPEITKAEREHTPAAFAVWLFQLAARCIPPAM